MDGRKSIGMLVAVLIAGPLAAAEMTPEARAKAEKRMQELSREMAELGRQLGEERRLRFLEDRMVAMNRAMLGINVDDEASRAKGEGVVVAAVTPNGPAGKAGLRSGDLIVALDGKPLKAEGDDSPFERLREAMSGKEPGDAARLKVKRDGKSLDLTVTTEAYAPRAFSFGFSGPALGELDRLRELEVPMVPLPPTPGMTHFRAFAREWGDLEMVSLTPRLGEYFGAKDGVLVVHAPSAKQLALEDGDVITKVGDRKPTSPEQVMRILRSYDAGEKLRVEVLRNRKPVALEVVVPERRSGGRWTPEPDRDVEVIIRPD